MSIVVAMACVVTHHDVLCSRSRVRICDSCAYGHCYRKPSRSCWLVHFTSPLLVSVHKDGCNKYVEFALYTLYILVCRERKDHEVIAWKLPLTLCPGIRDGSAAPGSFSEFAMMEDELPPMLGIGGA